jgi:serine/threonine-protein kinase haspin
MASVHPQSSLIETPLPRRKTSAPTTRTSSGKRKVYGKRKKDAPRAVFDQRSPAKKTETDAIDDAVDCIEAKLANIQINERAVAENVREDDNQESTDTINETHTHIADETPTSTQEPPTELSAEPASIQQPSAKSTLVNKKRYQTMVEVRITPMIIPQEQQGQVRENLKNSRNCLDSCKRGTRKCKSSRRASSDYVSNDKAASYVRSILKETMSPVAAQGIQKFDAWAARAGEMLEVVKLAEGSYGEVYKLRLREDICQKEMSKSKLARLKACGDGVFKVVPLRAQSGPGSKKFTSIEEIVAEIKMLKYLDPIPGFARLREIHVVQGRFPGTFQKAWDHYKKTKDDCLNPNPSSKRAYPDSQIWAIIEMDDAGSELEKFSWSSIFQVYDIFWGVAMALARAEEYALFEVRSFEKILEIHLTFETAPGSPPWQCLHSEHATRWSHAPTIRL